jgi:hypothetical protein
VARANGDLADAKEALDYLRRARQAARESSAVTICSNATAMKIARHRGMKKAIVALARRLAVIMHRLWVDGTEFRWVE